MCVTCIEEIPIHTDAKQAQHLAGCCAFFLRLMQCVGVLLPLALAACTEADPHQKRFVRYHERVSAVLEQPVNIVPIEPVARALPYPSSKALQIAFPAQAVNLLEWLEMGGCRLQTLLAERNTGLAKVQPPSQRLLYELQFLALAPECITALEQRDEPELAESLRAVQQQKQRQLPQRLWLAILGGTEQRDFWQTHRPLQDYPAHVNQAPLKALAGLTGWVEDVLAGRAVEPKDLEHYLAQLRYGDGGALLQALYRQQHHLQQINTTILQRIAERAVCFNHLPSRTSERFEQVVRRYFIIGIQPWAAQVSQRYHQLLPAQQRLETLLAPGEPSSYREWRTTRDKWLAEALAANKRHVVHIKRLLQPCGSGFGQ